MSKFGVGFAYGIIVMLVCVIAANAQSINTDTSFGVKATPIKSYKNISNCLNVDCDLSFAQASAIGSALSLYHQDMQNIKEPLVSVGVEAGLIMVTLSPKYVGVPDYSREHFVITYVFDSSGNKMLRKIYSK